MASMTPEPMAAPVAPAPAVDAPPPGYPRDYDCPCGGTLEIPRPGCYVCQRCGTYFRVSSRTGEVTDYAALNPHILNFKLPVANELMAHLETLLGSFLRIRHFPDKFSEELLQANRKIGEIVLEGSGPADTLQLLAVCNQSEMVIGFRTSNNPFTEGHRGGHPQLRNVANRVDRIELFPLTSNGELLKLIKRV